MEKQIVDMAKHLKEQHYPVFPEEDIKWAKEAIEGSGYAKFFPNGKPTRGWFYGWLRRVDFFTRNLRPLE
jgi:hypothetical protein